MIHIDKPIQCSTKTTLFKVLDLFGLYSSFGLPYHQSPALCAHPALSTPSFGHRARHHSARLRHPMPL